MINTLDCKAVLFADDSTLIISANSGQNLEIKANNIMIQLEKYLLANNLFLNIEKTQFISFNNQPLTIYFNKIKIQQVQESKLLGVILDDKFKFTHQTIDIAQKINKSLPILYKYNKTPFFIRKILFNAFVMSHINYNSLIPINLSKSTIKILHKTYSKAKKYFSKINIMKIQKKIYTHLKRL